MPSMPLSRASSAMMCSREVNTTLPMATNALFADGLTDDRKRLLADLAIRRDIVRIADVEFIDLRLGHKFIDVECGRAARDRPATSSGRRSWRRLRTRSRARVG